MHPGQAEEEDLPCRCDEPMDPPLGADAASVGIGQWKRGINFGEFSDLTVKRNFSGKAPTE